MRAELLQSLYARMQAVAAGDPEPVLAPEALAEADQLLTLLGTPEGPDFRVLHAVGHLLWSRCAVLGEQAHPPIELAQMLLAPLFVQDASLVPAELAAHLEPYRSPSDVGEAGRSHDLGSSLAEIAIWLDEPSTYAGAVDLLTAAVTLSGADDSRRPTYLAALGKVLRRRYQSRAEPADLDDAIGVLRECRSASPTDDPDLVGTLIELGIALCLAFERTEDPAPLREAVDIARTVLAIPLPAPPERDTVLDFATTVLTTAAGPHQDVALVADAVELARRAVDASGADDPQRPVRVGRLALTLDQVPDDAALTHEATRLMCRAIPAIPLGDPTRLSLLSALRNRLLLRDEPQVDDDILAMATAVFEQAIGASSPEQPDYALCHAGLAAALQLRWLRTDDDQVRDRMLDAVRAMSAAVPEDQAARHYVEFADVIGAGRPRVDGAGLEWSRAEDRAALDAAVRTLRSAVGAVPVNRRLLPMWLADLAELLYGRCRWRPDAAGVVEAIGVHRRLLRMTQDRHAQWTVGLASLLRQSFLLTADDAALAEAVAILRAAELDPHTRYELSTALVDLAAFTGDVDLRRDAEAAVRAVLSAGDPPEAMPSSWHNLGVTLGLRYERSGEGLAEAIDAARRSTALGGSEPTGQSEQLARLAQLLALDEEYDEAVQVARQAMTDHPESPTAQRALAEVLRLRYQRFGRPEELDESISLLREAVRSTSEPVSRSSRLSGLATALRTRYGRSADLDTLEEALAAGRQAVRELPEVHQDRTKLYANLMVPLLEHYKRTGDAASLEEAIGIGREVTASTPADHPGLGIRLRTFATLLTAEFRRAGDRRVLEEALEVDRRAVDLAPPGHPERALRLSNLSVALCLHVELTGDPDSADAAVRAAREAVAGTPADHPSRAGRLINLAVAMGFVVDRTGDAARARGGSDRRGGRPADRCRPFDPAARVPGVGLDGGAHGPVGARGGGLPGGRAAPAAGGAQEPAPRRRGAPARRYQRGACERGGQRVVGGRRRGRRGGARAGAWRAAVLRAGQSQRAHRPARRGARARRADGAAHRGAGPGGRAGVDRGRGTGPRPPARTRLPMGRLAGPDPGGGRFRTVRGAALDREPAPRRGVRAGDHAQRERAPLRCSDRGTGRGPSGATARADRGGRRGQGVCLPGRAGPGQRG